MDAVEIIPPDGPINATVRPPGSKSITNRALPIAAVAKGTSTLTGVLKSDDTIYMIKALKQLGVKIDDSKLSDIPEESVVIVHGCDGRFPATEADLFLGNSGTSIRFLTAMVAACGRGTYRLDGIERMRERPIGDLVDALKQLGVEVSYDVKAGFPPVAVSTTGFFEGTATIRGNTSSQFLSGLEMSIAASQRAAAYEVIGDVVSIPYVTMTGSVLRAFRGDDDAIGQFTLFDSVEEPKPLRGIRFDIEPDASAASYWLAAGTIDGTLAVAGIEPSFSIQGDTAFENVLDIVGASVSWLSTNQHSHSELPETGTVVSRGSISGGTFDFSDISDTAQTMAAVAVFADSPTTITGVEHMRHKECDRVSAVVTELRKLGIKCDEHTDGYTIYPGTPVCKEPIETYDDHRMAMSFALLGLKVPGIIIKDPDCVNKTYPRFWDDWAKVTNKPVRRFTL